MRVLLVLLCLITILAALFLGGCMLIGRLAPMVIIPLGIVALNVALIVATATRKAPSLKPLFFATGGIDLAVAAWLATIGLSNGDGLPSMAAAAFALKGGLALVIPVWAARPPRDPPPRDDAARPDNPFADE